MPRRKTPPPTLAEAVNFPRDPVSGRLIDPSTGKFFRRTNAMMDEFRDIILDVIRAEPKLTLRRLHYALVSRGVQPNVLTSYQNLSAISVEMRRGGSIPRGTFVDNARETLYPNIWDSLAEAVASLIDHYRRSPWTNSEDRVLVMVEKDALRGVLWPTCSSLGVPLGIARGRASESFLEDMAEVINDEASEYAGNLHVGYLGDWDPTGWANPDDIEKRLRGFLDDESRMTFTRLGLNPAQITALGLPTSMVAKSSDPNYARWPGGTVAVEVDAVPVAELQRIVRDFIGTFITQAEYDAAEDAAAEDVEKLEAFAAT